MRNSLGLLYAAGIGFTTGLRSMMGPAAVALATERRALPRRRGALAFVGFRRAASALTIAAAGEIIADKLPFTPARTNLPSLAFRIAAGSVSGAAIGSATRSSVKVSALLGGLGAIAGAYAGYYVRAAATRALHSKDCPVAVSEDLLASGLATLIVTAA